MSREAREVPSGEATEDCLALISLIRSRYPRDSMACLADPPGEDLEELLTRSDPHLRALAKAEPKDSALRLVCALARSAKPGSDRSLTFMTSSAHCAEKGRPEPDDFV